MAVGSARGNLPELIESAEVIEPDVVAVLRGPAQALNPPLVASRFHHIPAVKRIAPALAGLAEEIRRDAGNNLGLEIVIRAEEVAVRPDVGAVVVHEDSDIAHDANGAFCAVAPQGLPLFVEGELQCAADLQIDRQLLACLVQRTGFAARQALRPFIPASPACAARAAHRTERNRPATRHSPRRSARKRWRARSDADARKLRPASNSSGIFVAKTSS